MAVSNEPRGKWPKAIGEQTLPDRHGLLRGGLTRGALEQEIASEWFEIAINIQQQPNH